MNKQKVNNKTASILNSVWKSSYEFQFLLILMSNYDHFWNNIQIFSFFSQLGLWVIRAADVCIFVFFAFLMAPKMARLIIIVKR